MIKIGKYHKVVCQTRNGWPTYHTLNMRQLNSPLLDGDVVIVLEYKQFNNDPNKQLKDSPVARYKVLNSFGTTSYIYSSANINSSPYRLEAVDSEEK